MKKAMTFVLGAAALLSLGIFASCRHAEPPPSAEAAEATATRYSCPMHPTFISDRPGECAICGMTLVAIEEAAGEPVSHEGHASSGAVAGRVAVTISPERRQLLGVTSERVRRDSLERTIRTVGRVAVDERRLHHVHTKYEGYVENLAVDFTGKFVRRGQRLLSIYSPVLVATQEEYLLAYRAQEQLSRSGIASAAKGGVDLLDAARRRLLLWDIAPEDIAELERRGEVTRTLDLHAEVSGFVVEKSVFQGMRVTPADTLFDIADLSHLWIFADVYESELSSVRVGMRGDVTVSYLPGRNFSGPVTWISPMVEEATRTVKVRLEVDNPENHLKPEMFVDVHLRSLERDTLVVPASAVIDTGERKLVFLDRGEGRFEPRDVVLGRKAGDVYPVLEGLADGDAVVTSANFLIDSESSLKAAIGGMESAHQH